MTPTKPRTNHHDYCGCCGVHEIGPSRIWCPACEKHVASTGDLWMRTYEVLHNEPCPEVAKEEARNAD